MYDIDKNYLPKEALNDLYDDDLLTFVKREFERRRTERLKFELEWVLNINFIESNQYVEINEYNNEIQPVLKEFWWQVQDVFNEIAPIYETRLAKLKRVTPTLKVRPASSDKNDLSSAKVSTKLLETTSRSQKMKDKSKNSNAWMEAAGSVLYKTIWNKESGRVLEFEDKVVREGDLQTFVVPVFEFYPDSCYTEDIDDLSSIIHAKAYSVQEIRDNWSIEETGSDITVFSLNKEHKSVKTSMRTTVSSMVKHDSAMVYEYMEKPSKAYPKGRTILCTDNHIISKTNLIYLVGDDQNPGFPFVMCKSIERAGVFWGKSVVTRLIPLQKRYNVIKSRKAEYINRASIGQLTYEDGSIDDEAMAEEGLAPGAMIPYKRGYNPPKYLEYHGLPSTFETEEASILADFNRISGISEISRDSKAPTGVNSGIALSILQEQDDTRIALTAENIENMYINLGKMWLRIFRQFATEKRTLRVIGKDNSVEVIDWCASSLTSEDIYIDASSKLSETPAQRKQMVFDLLNTGLFNDPETGVITKEGRLKVFEMLELGNWEDYDDDDNLHAQKAVRENMKLATKNEAAVAQYDDDIIHIQKHNAYRLTSAYEELIEDDPEFEQLFEEHVNAHLEQMKAKAMAQAAPPEIQENLEDLQNNALNSTEGAI